MEAAGWVLNLLVGRTVVRACVALAEIVGLDRGGVAATEFPVDLIKVVR